MAIANELTINTTATAMDMAEAIFGDGITVVSAGYSGDSAASGIYSGALSTIPGIVSADGGVILSTGNVGTFTNSSGTTDTNAATGSSTDLPGGVDGDAQLNALSGQATFDGTILTADFIPTGDMLTMQFVFSSEEYPEYVNGGVNDSFGVWVNGQFVEATISIAGNISIDSVNQNSNQNLYRDNTADQFNTEMDGFTYVLSFKAPVSAGQVNTIKIGIADGGDSIYDSNLLIMGDSIQTLALAMDDTVQLTANSSRTFDILANDRDLTNGGLTITHINGTAVVAGETVTLGTGEQVRLNADGTVTVFSDGDIGTNTLTYSVVDSAGNTDVGYIFVKTVAVDGPDGVVEGTAGADVIDGSYLGDPDGDRVDANDGQGVSGTVGDADYIIAGDGNDTVVAGAGNDIVYAGTGDDSVSGGVGDDWVALGAGNDRFAGDSAGNDTVFGGSGNDTLDGGSGADSLMGEAGDDRFNLSAGFGGDQLIGGETGESLGDKLSLAGLTGAVTVDLRPSDAEAGTVSQGSDTASFSQIETIELGSATETLLLADGSGADRVTGFAVPTASARGGWVGHDQLNVAGLTDAQGQPVDVADVVVGTDGDGNAVLNFPNGESLTLVGVAPAAVSNPAVLVAMGIPAVPLHPDYVVEGGAGDDVIDSAYQGDPEGDRVDAQDNEAGNDDDKITAGAGDDHVSSGAGADTVQGEAGQDTLEGDAGADILSGGDGGDLLDGGAGDDTLYGDDPGQDSAALPGTFTFGLFAINSGGMPIDNWVTYVNGTSTFDGSADAALVSVSDDETGFEDYGAGGNSPVDGGAPQVLTEAVTITKILSYNAGVPVYGEVTFPAGTPIHAIAQSDISNLTTGETGNAWVIQIGSDNTNIFYGYDIAVHDGDQLHWLSDNGGGQSPIFADVTGLAYGDLVMADGQPANHNDTLSGGAGNDLLHGNIGDDDLDGGSGNDTLYGDAGADSLQGGDDRDLIFGGIDDVVDGGEGGDDFDTLDLTAWGSGATNILYDPDNPENGTVEFLDQDGNVIGTMTFSNIEAVVACFTPGAMILTERGEIAVEDLQPGDRVLTRDHGYQPIRWVGRRDLTAAELAAEPRFNPVHIAAGALGAGLPHRNMAVSPQHRILVTGPRSELLFGEYEVLIAAKHLVGRPGIEQRLSSGVSYIHILFDAHEIVRADGAWSESFQPGARTMDGMDGAQRDEILALFPMLRMDVDAFPAARLTLKAREAQVLVRA